MARYGITSVTGTPPTITFPLLLAGSVGALLIYCAVVGKTPPQVLKEVMMNQPPATGGQNALTGIFGTAAKLGQQAAQNDAARYRGVVGGTNKTI